MRQKLLSSPRKLLFDTLPQKYLLYLRSFCPSGALNALQWRVIPENINLGKIGNILTLQLGYHGWFKHHINWNKTNSSYHTKILLISYLQYKSHLTEAIFTMKTIAIHFPPKCLTGVSSNISKTWWVQIGFHFNLMTTRLDAMSKRNCMLSIWKIKEDFR